MRRPATTVPVVALAALVACLPVMAAADESSGTWTGNVEARGNYYWETSTRVLAPEISVNVESPGGVRLNGHYLLDSITSASIASGALTDVRFNEIRHDFGFGTGHEFDLGEAQLDLSVNGRYSQEPDYSSLAGTVSTSLSLADRATVLRFNFTAFHDEVGKILRGNDTSSPDGGDLSNRGKQGDLNGMVMSFLWSQALTPRLTLDVGYDLGLLSGYLQNPYRAVVVDSVLLSEVHPDQRTRHTVHGRLGYFFKPTDTAFHLIYRAYMDNWDIAALTPEVRVYQEIGSLVLLRGRYRYYTQTRSFFQSNQGYSGSDEFWTADPKMTEFESHLVGGLIVVRLEFLERSILDFAWNATVEVGLEYIWRTNSFGNGVIGQVGLNVPF
ncbi:MAG: hypothetical protein DRJ42_17490 [Deltaproteobacteria bacterium]|nr:MAG: hypothetical protein DRJ42_17490 [Deltaproteobacteria bacterium]